MKCARPPPGPSCRRMPEHVLQHVIYHMYDLPHTLAATGGTVGSTRGQALRAHDAPPGAHALRRLGGHGPHGGVRAGGVESCRAGMLVQPVSRACCLILSAACLGNACCSSTHTVWHGVSACRPCLRLQAGLVSCAVLELSHGLAVRHAFMAELWFHVEGAIACVPAWVAKMHVSVILDELAFSFPFPHLPLNLHELLCCLPIPIPPSLNRLLPLCVCVQWCCAAPCAASGTTLEQRQRTKWLCWLRRLPPLHRPPRPRPCWPRVWLLRGWLPHRLS